MSQLCLTQMSIHSLSWFSRSVHTIIHCLETIVQLKWHHWLTDILKIPALFLSVLILLSHPFSSADFKALRCSSVHGGGRFVPGDREDETTQGWWGPVPGPGFPSLSLKGEIPLAPNSANLLRAQLSARLFIQHTQWVAVCITGRTGRGYLGRETRTTFTRGELWRHQAPRAPKAHVHRLWGTKPSSDVKHLWVLCGKGALRKLHLWQCCTAAGCGPLIPHMSRFVVLPHHRVSAQSWTSLRAAGRLGAIPQHHS